VSEPAGPVSPALFSRIITAAEQTSILEAALELEVFAAFRGRSLDAAAVAEHCDASERGVRILCDCLVALGFLTKEAGRYAPTPDSATFLDPASSSYVGAGATFLRSAYRREGFDRLAEAVRAGGAVVSDEGLLGAEDPIWVTFARAMAPLARLHAKALAGAVELDKQEPQRILDIAAGHGLFGLALAERNPAASVVAVDWPNVLKVAADHAEQSGLSERYDTRPGSALEVDYGSGYDLALLTGFLHLFDTASCERLLAKAHAALADGGRAVIVDFIPDAEKVAPPVAATFAAVMLVTTPGGDAWTFEEYRSMAGRAGFARSEPLDLPGSPLRAVVCTR
jgi:2-polyprenyl-3-methyl-5-hydroxy-6-metoxy-1,4-benzoquinol methylase